MRKNPVSPNGLRHQEQSARAKRRGLFTSSIRLPLTCIVVGIAVLYCSQRSIGALFDSSGSQASGFALVELATASLRNLWDSATGQTQPADNTSSRASNDGSGTKSQTAVEYDAKIIAQNGGVTSGITPMTSAFMSGNSLAAASKVKSGASWTDSATMAYALPSLDSVPPALDVDATAILWSSAAGAAWLTGSNWTGGAVPNGTQTAEFGVNPTAATGVGINFNGTTNAGVQTNGQRIQEVGAVYIDSNRAAAMIIGNSSSTAGATGKFRLNGVTVNGVDNVIIRNNSSQLLTIQNTQGSGTQAMSVLLGNATNNIINIDGTGGVTISSVIINDAGNKLTLGGGGTGALTLSGANTYTGGTTVGTGILQIGSNTVSGTTITSSAVGTGTLTLGNGATLRSDGATARTLRNNLSLSGNIVLGANATQTGDLAFNSSGLTTPSTVVLTANTQLTTIVATAINNVISGSGMNLTKAGANFLDLGAINTFSGTFSANGGGTFLNVNGALGSVTAVVVGTGALLGSPGLGTTTNVINDSASLTINGTGHADFTGDSETVGSLSSASGGALLSIGDLGASAGSFTVGDTNSTTYAGVIDGSRATAGPIFTKQGSGTLTLTGANTYSGDTLIATNGGTLRLDSAGVITPRLTSTANITVNSGGTLLLANSTGTASTNRINNGAAINLAGGTFNLGGFSEGAAGTNGVGALTLTANSTIDFGPLGTNNLIQFAGLGTHTASTVLQILNWEGTAGSPSGNDRLLFAGTSSAFTTAYPNQSDVSFNGASGYGVMDFAGFYEVYGLVPVPEPSTWAAAALAAAVVGYQFRVTRRRRLSTR